MAEQTKGQEGQGGKDKSQAGRPSSGESSGQGEGIEVRRESQPTLTQAGLLASPFSVIRRFSEEMDRLFEDFGFGRSQFPWISTGGGRISRGEFGGAAWNPPIEMFTRGDQLVVRAELPGLSKDDVKVECTNDMLTIDGERRQEHKEEKEGRIHSEMSYGRYYRSVPLPEGVKCDNAKASFKDGILEVTLKAPEKSKPRQINIES
jgi:HSP20 family protein